MKQPNFQSLIEDLQQFETEDREAIQDLEMFNDWDNVQESKTIESVLSIYNIGE